MTCWSSLDGIAALTAGVVRLADFGRAVRILRALHAALRSALAVEARRAVRVGRAARRALVRGPAKRRRRGAVGILKAADAAKRDELAEARPNRRGAVDAHAAIRVAHDWAAGPGAVGIARAARRALTRNRVAKRRWREAIGIRDTIAADAGSGIAFEATATIVVLAAARAHAARRIAV
jgi:hypothetical protein